MQQFVVCMGLATCMSLSSLSVLSKTMTVGDFVMVNTYLLQVCRHKPHTLATACRLP